MRRIRRTLMSLKFLLLILWSALRETPVHVPALPGSGGRGTTITPAGFHLPAIGGADPEEDEDDDHEEEEEDDLDEDARRLREEEEQDGEIDDDDELEPEFQGEFDADRAKRAIAAERAKRKREKKKLQKRAREAEDRARELEQANESEQQRTVRERDEARVEAERERNVAQKLRVDIAIREAAADAGVPSDRMRRVLRLIDRDEIEVDGEDLEGVEDAVAALLEDIPELKGKPAPEPKDDDEDDEEPENPGGRPDRKRKPKQLSAKQAQKLAKEDPARFNQLFDEGKIPQSALEGA